MRAKEVGYLKVVNKKNKIVFIAYASSGIFHVSRRKAGINILAIWY